MKLKLSGYFDNNFGDDYIIKLIAQNLPDVEFVTEAVSAAGSIVFDEPNITVTDKADDTLKHLVVIGSGFMINSSSALKSEFKKFLKNENPGDYCLGCNIEPLDGFWKRFLIRRKLNKFKLIVCRDYESFKWLKENVKNPDVYYLPDIGFSLPLLKRDYSQNCRLGISVMNIGSDMKSTRYYAILAKAADYYISQTGNAVNIMAFNSGSENDAYACGIVQGFMKYPDSATIYTHGAKGEIFEAVSECRKIIATRFHSAVIAVKNGIDTYPVIYRSKMKNLIDDLNYPRLGSRLSDLTFDDLKNFIDSPVTEFILEKEYLNPAAEYATILKNFISCFK